MIVYLQIRPETQPNNIITRLVYGNINTHQNASLYYWMSYFLNTVVLIVIYNLLPCPAFSSPPRYRM